MCSRGEVCDLKNKFYIAKPEKLVRTDKLRLLAQLFIKIFLFPLKLIASYINFETNNVFFKNFVEKIFIITMLVFFL